ncbi:MAG: serine/threonine protein kinase [Myxococcota bacterium]|nr:serine/threonine protein kinase [Myxococcota bacterium]
MQKPTSSNTKSFSISNRLVFLILALLFSSGFFTYVKMQEELRAIARFDLEKTLRANAESMLQYLSNKEREIDLIAHNSEIRHLSRSLHSMHVSQSNPQNDDMHLLLSKRIEQLTENSEYLHFYLLDKKRSIIATNDAERNRGDTLLDPNLLQVFQHDRAYIGLPMFMGNNRDIEPVMLIAKDLRDEKESFAILALSLKPDKNFSRVMRASRSGETGETYAMNRKGEMISNSRFLETLRESGFLRSADTTSVLKIQVLQSNGKPTQMAKRALSEQRSVLYPNIESNTDGYKDYRDVEVIGAWTFLEDYGFAIASEVDFEEAYKALNIIKRDFQVILTIAFILGIGIVLYSRFTEHIQKRFQAALIEARELGQYVLHEKIGEGGMGVVYLATHKMMQRDTALKLLKTDACTERDIKLFENEVRQTSKLKHPNTVSIYDYGKTEDGNFYYVMEYLRGIELDDIVHLFGPIPPSRAIYFLRQICSSLHEAHTAGLVHRDIKSQNIFITNRGGEHDIVKVLDFGLVRDTSQNDTELSESISGTPNYMAPESIENIRVVDHRADIYALGVLMYYILSGCYPFDDDDPMEILRRHVEEPPKPPSSLPNVSIPADLEEILMQCLHKDPEKRPRTVQELREKIVQCQAHGEWSDTHGQKWWEQHGEFIAQLDADTEEVIPGGETIQIDMR